jgi:multiple sugar transport system ATP-binding protein
VPTGLSAGTKLQVGIRPERLTARSGAGAFAGRLVYRENLGSDLFLHVALDGVLGPLIVRCDPSLLDTVSLGDSVPIDLSAEHLLLFDGDGKRIRPAGPGGVHG